MQTIVKPELIEKESIPNMTFRNEVNINQHPNLKKTNRFLRSKVIAPH